MQLHACCWLHNSFVALTSAGALVQDSGSEFETEEEESVGSEYTEEEGLEESSDAASFLSSSPFGNKKAGGTVWAKGEKIDVRTALHRAAHCHTSTHSHSH